MDTGEPHDPHLALPRPALDALAAFDGPVLVDLDETLYLRNSTEDFIDSARPGILVMLVLKLLEIVAPWRWTGGHETRDVWRVRLVGALFPWVWPAWRARCRPLAAEHGNAALLSALATRQPLPIVVTVGFLPVVTPLIAALGLAGARVVAARPDRFSDRSEGKLALAAGALGQDLVRQSMVITDSVADRPLLDACAQPLRVIWPEARYRPAFAGIYYPGRYILKVKRPDDRLYIARSILWEDFTLWVLCSVWVAALPVAHLAGLLLLLVSFWAIYERGYVDNDLVAERFEASPTLSRTFGKTEVATPSVEPWLWAAGCGTAAIVALRWPQVPAWSDPVAWAGVLLATWLWFRLYNRFDKATRVWLYLGLQLARSAAFLVLVPVVVLAPVAIAAHAFAKWLPYILYRAGRETRDWPGIPTHLVRVLCFAALALVLVAAEGPQAVFQASSVALLLFFAFKARREFMAVVRSARRIDR
ncbi:haloacid dehalogenase-like hydrolase [Paracoccaceae bacterium Fryx2]|nr:haloacid dehalogenase-like hydrolase [Paracoccaceae bacterium Fryx2]